MSARTRQPRSIALVRAATSLSLRRVGPWRPGGVELFAQEPACPLERDAFLRKAVAVADRDGAVLQRLLVDRERPRRPDLVLAPVALPDRGRGVVLDDAVLPQVVVEPACLLDERGVVADEREYRRLHRRDSRVQPHHRPRPLLDNLLVVAVDEEGERGPVGPPGRLDHVRDVALLVADPLELRPGVLGVLAEVVVAAVRDPLQLRPADWEQVLDVARRARVVGELLTVVRPHSQVALAESEIDVPAEALVDPVAEPLLRLVRRHEELH